MRQILSILLISLFLISCHIDSNNQEKKTTDQSSILYEKIDQYFSALNEIGKFNGVVYASKNDTLIINKAYNLYEDISSTTYVTTESQFDIHSVSKLMARYVLEKFEYAGKVKKSQLLSTFITDFPEGDKITIEMLLNHTSGLPRNFENIVGDEIDLSSGEIIAYAKKQKLLFEPGTEKQYSNVAYELIHFIIEEISKKTFAQCLSDEIFRPLGMKSSGAHFYLIEHNLKNLAKNHEKDDSLIVQVDNVLKDELKTARIFSTASDLNKFLNHIRAKPYGTMLQNEAHVIEKSGGSDGIRVEVYTHLQYNYNFIFLANYEEVPFQKTVEDFAKILEGRPYEIPVELNRIPIPVSSDLLNRYVGTYLFADMGNLELVFDIEENNLVVYQDEERIASLNAESDYIFFDDPKEAESFEFIDNEKGAYDVLMGWKGVKLKGVRK